MTSLVLPGDLPNAHQLIVWLAAENQRLQDEVAQRGRHAAYNIPNLHELRSVWHAIDFDAYYVAFADIDHLKKRNDELTQAVVDQRLAAAFDAIRAEMRGNDHIYLYDQGDMLCILLPRCEVFGGQRTHVDPMAALLRIQAHLVAHGMSISAALVQPTRDLVETATRAERLYKAARGGDRDTARRGVLVQEAL